MMSDDFRRFLTPPRSPPNVRFLPSNVRFFWVILDPPSPPKIGHHLCTFPNCFTNFTMVNVAIEIPSKQTRIFNQKQRRQIIFFQQQFKFHMAFIPIRRNKVNLALTNFTKVNLAIQIPYGIHTIFKTKNRKEVASFNYCPQYLLTSESKKQRQSTVL